MINQVDWRPGKLRHCLYSTLAEYVPCTIARYPDWEGHCAPPKRERGSTSPAVHHPPIVRDGDSNHDNILLEYCNVTSPNINIESASFVGPDTHTCILQVQRNPFLTPEESSPVERKMRQRCFELARERWRTNPPLTK
ncbi:hypothetical protein TNCV_406031 [Trichonephila clavipes]|nr:hypothetical protein TNCV_406031 [Trichonephila clavipes]